MTKRTFVNELAAAVSAVRFSEIGEPTLEKTLLHALDTLGAMIAGEPCCGGAPPLR